MQNRLPAFLVRRPAVIFLEKYQPLPRSHPQKRECFDGEFEGGFRVFLKIAEKGLRDCEAAEKTLKLVTERYPNVKASAVKADVSKEADVKAAVDKAVELFGRLDVMVSTTMCQFWKRLS